MLGCSDGFVEEYDLRNHTSPILSKKVHNGYVSSVHLTHSNSIISSSLDGVVATWDLRGENNTAEQHQVLADHDCITSCCVDEKHQVVVAGGSSGILYISSFN